MFKGAPVPILRIFSVEKALEFYAGFLGFEERFRHQFDPAAPWYLGYARDGVMLHLSEHFGDASPGTHVRIEVDDVAAFAAQLNAKAYRHSRPHFLDQEWGNREMTIADPFGNRVTFWQPIPKANTGLKANSRSSQFAQSFHRTEP
jgi:catechol 2,3-dioxygenase-like lactoylglutathione lyase family enzyme